MRKANAIAILGGTSRKAASQIGITYDAIEKWPDELPPRIADRVYAALARRMLPKQLLRQLESTEDLQDLQPAIEVF